MYVTELNSLNFTQTALEADKPVLIDFWAPWCGPCRMQSPVIEELARELSGSAVIAKVNVDESPELAATFGVMSIPTLIVLRHGKVIERMVGVQRKDRLLDAIDAAEAA
ncbi:MAG: thioredoxin [Clostridia bacterium]|nr:thioredoxin [Clostridia bacterium]MDR3643446.1 thioredoxin [Clostridia bacterium]